MKTQNIPSCEGKLKLYPCYDSGHGAMINTHLLEFALFRTYFMVPRVFEPVKFYCISNELNFSCVYRSVNYSATQAKFHSLCTRSM